MTSMTWRVPPENVYDTLVLHNPEPAGQVRHGLTLDDSLKAVSEWLQIEGPLNPVPCIEWFIHQSLRGVHTVIGVGCNADGTFVFRTGNLEDDGESMLAELEAEFDPFGKSRARLLPPKQI